MNDGSLSLDDFNDRLSRVERSERRDGGNQQVEELLETDPMVRAIYERHVGMLDDTDD